MRCLSKAAVRVAAAIALALSCLPACPAPAAAAELPAPAWPKVLRSGAHALKLSWEPVEGAESYAIYRYDKAKDGYVKVKATNKTRWRDTGLESDVTYRYRVAACAKAGGKRPGKRSYSVAARAYSKGAAFVNPSRPAVRKKSATVALGAVANSYDVTSGVKVTSSVFGRKIGARGCETFSNSVRYVSSRASIIKCKRRGSEYLMHSVNAGNCKLYAVAANGVRSGAVKVSVVDYTRPTRFADPGFHDPEIVVWMNDEADALSRVVKSCITSGFSAYCWLGTDGGVVCSYDSYNGADRGATKRLGSYRGLLSDVRELLEHEVDGVSPYMVRVCSEIRIGFESDVMEGENYEIGYDPYNRGRVGDSRTLAMHWRRCYSGAF